MARADQMDKSGFVYWYRQNGVTGTLRQRFELYLIMKGIKH